MLPVKWHMILLGIVYAGALPALALVIWLGLNWLFWTWLGVLAVLNFTPSRDEKWHDQKWIV